MSISRLVPLLLALFCVFNVLSVTNAVEVTISLTGSNSSFPGLQGSTATFVCEWSSNSTVEYATELTFSSIKRPNIYSYAVGNRFQMETTKGNDYDPSRMSTSPVNNNVVSVTLTLSDLGCEDDDTYRCTLSWCLSDGSQQQDKVSETVSTLQVPPSPPVITVLSGDPRDGLREHDLLVVKCEANVGSSGKGKLHWRIYRGHGTEDVAPTDQRVNTSTADNLSCWDQITSELTTRVTRDDQDMVVTCFVTNDDFAPAASQPVACEDNTLCDQTQKLHIDQTVILNPSPLTPDGFITPGRPLVIHCNADIVGLDPQFVTIVRLVISRQLRGASTMQNIAIFSPYAQFIPPKPAIDNPSHRDWEVSYSDAPPLSLGVNSRNLSMIWTLNDARATDMGIYQCTVDCFKKNWARSFIGQQRITERDTLELILTQHPPRSQALREGDDLELICSARGVYDPISMILIRERTSELLASDLTTELTHTLKDLSCLDTGVYVCRGQSSQNKTERAISVHVYCPTDFIPSFKPRRFVYAAIGETFHLDLEVYGFPEPKALGLHTVNDGEDLQTHPRFLLQYTEGEAPFGFVNLTISNIVKEDFAYYALTMNNGRGASLGYFFDLKKDSVDLILTQHPPMSQPLREGDDLELICSAPGIYDPISMILIRERTSELLASDLTTELTHTLKDLSCLDTGVYVCRGQSSQTKTERAISVHVYCPPRFIPSFEPLSVVDAAIGETVHIDLEIYGFPEPKALALHTVNDGEYLQTHPRFLLQYTEGEAPFGFVNLTISNIVKEDFTNYTLTVNNGEGGALAYTFCLNQVHGTTDKGHNLDSLSIIIGIIAVVVITGLGITILFLLTTNGNLKRKLDSRAKTEGKVIVHPMELFPVTDTEPSPDSLSQPELYETIRDVIPASAQDPDTHDSDNYEVPVVNTDSRWKSGIRFNNPTYS